MLLELILVKTTVCFVKNAPFIPEGVFKIVLHKTSVAIESKRKRIEEPDNLHFK